MAFECSAPLAEFYAAAEHEAMIREESVSLGELATRIGRLPDQGSEFIEALIESPEVAVIAEHKRQSPSGGRFPVERTVRHITQSYERGGATALSILTQQADFGGCIEDLRAAHTATDIPILRKDFISNPYQLYEARAYGAAAVLLIVAGLPDSTLLDLYEEAHDLDLDCLVEVQDEEELERAQAIGAKLIGINNRNLTTQQINLRTTQELIEYIPDKTTVVAESGYSIRNPQQLRDLRSMQVDAVLIGSSLMRVANPGEELEAWLQCT